MANRSDRGPGEFGWLDQYNHDGITEEFGHLQLGGLEVGGLELGELELEGLELEGLEIWGLKVEGLGLGYHLLVALVLGISLLQVRHTDKW